MFLIQIFYGSGESLLYPESQTGGDIETLVPSRGCRTLSGPESYGSRLQDLRFPSDLNGHSLPCTAIILSKSSYAPAFMEIAELVGRFLV